MNSGCKPAAPDFLARVAQRSWARVVNRLLVSGLIALASGTAWPLAAAVARAGDAPVACAGDCSGDGAVAVNELVSGVKISLGTLPVSACQAFDSNHDQRVSISELVSGVNSALLGCTSNQIPEDVASNMMTVGDADDFFRQTNADDPVADRMRDTATFLMGQPGVTATSIFPNGLAVRITHSNGLESALMLMPDFAEGSSTEGAAAAVRSNVVGRIAAGDVPTNAVLIQGRDLTERLVTVHYPTMESTLHNMGFGIGDADKGVVSLGEEKYTTDFFRTQLGKYQIIYVIGHGGNNGTKSALATGKLGAPGAEFPSPAGADATDLGKKLLLTSIVSPGMLTRLARWTGYDSGPHPRYLVTADFIANYYKDKDRLAPDSLVFLNGCNLLEDLPKALATAGAAAVVYYAGNNVDTETTQLGTPPIDRRFFAALAEGKTVDEAIVAAKVGASHVTLSVYPPEGGQLRFIPLQAVDFSPSCEFPEVSTDVTFTQDTVMPANAQIAKWQWDFGDRTPPQESTFLPSSTSNQIVHKYDSATEDSAKPGYSTPFKVTLTATDLFGHKVKKEKELRLLTGHRRVGRTSGSCPVPPPTPTEEIRVKVIMTYSEDPNDLIASSLYNVHVLIGSTDAVIGDDDNIARVVVAPGTHVIKFPKDNGLDDENGAHQYRVGSVNVHVTKNGDSGIRCAPNSQEGDVVTTFDPSAANPGALSEYEVALRIVPYDAPALENGATCN
jgi:hypothetical protein